ncbi:hypothetical protein MTR67_017740 [Solanum verrucosum]|uniref:Protein kinase domain-containing protein n=1 Tax=Solanum verrucosum TaxID=315347 RepID=A0AAF0TSH8_SOLVR|nr:hypothetical protein MTR67_017740 [Solanum verrucosum]
MWPETRQSHPFESQRDEVGRFDLGNYFQNLLILYLAKCQFVGSIPSSLANASKLLEPDFPINNFSGNIPKVSITCGICCSGVTNLDTGNSLQGTIPIVEDFPDIQSLDLSLNNLSGPIPHFIANVTSLLYLNLSFNNSGDEVLVTGIFSNLKDQPAPEDRSKSARFYPNIFYEELRTAIGVFSAENLIGSCNFGTVYKGTFTSDRTVVAVKVLKLQHEEKEIHGKSSLTILQRMNIILDVAYALQYLNHECQTPMIHCDIKPQNILLDKELTAHLGDFGLVKLVPEFSNESDLHQFSSLGVMGTIGHVALGNISCNSSGLLNFKSHDSLVHITFVLVVPASTSSVEKNDHLIQDPPTDDAKKACLSDDARLILQIINSIDVVGLVNYCEFVKELMDYLEYLYSGKCNISQIYEVSKAFYLSEKEAKSLTTYFMEFKKTTKVE